MSPTELLEILETLITEPEIFSPISTRRVRCLYTYDDIDMNSMVLNSHLYPKNESHYAFT